MVESTALEMRRTGNRTVGSNPTLSAKAVRVMVLKFPSRPRTRQESFSPADIRLGGHLFARLVIVTSGADRGGEARYAGYQHAERGDQ